MSLPHPTNIGCCISSRSSEAVKLDNGPISVKKSDTGRIWLYEDNGSKERIKKMFKKTDLSVSSYDTAWMAMVPSLVNPEFAPQFPSCLNWVLNNQLSDGSWGLSPDRAKTLTMDALSSTLACVVALKQWGIGERQINMGLDFIAMNSDFVNDDKQRKPIGFDIIFPGMIEKAKFLNMNVPIRLGDLDALLQRRNLELSSSSVEFTEGRRAYLSYVSEGMGIYQDWEMAIKFKRKNGSLLNSPSATAAAFSYLHDPDCLRYLNLLLDRFGDAVPTVHPQDIYTKLWMVDNLEKLGIHHHFKEEIEDVLQETYRLWLQKEEEIFEDTTTCAMAFRILRWHGYDVSSDALRRFGEEDCFRNTLEGYLRETGPVLELYKASQIVIHQDELILEDISSWTRNLLTGFLKQEKGLLDKYLSKEVEQALMFPYYADMERLANMRNIQNYSNIVLGNSRVLKTAVSSSAIGNKDFLSLAVEDFNKCQLIHQQELKDLDRWVVEKRLHKLKFARQKQAYCYFSAAASMPTPELSDARMSWAKNSVLGTAVDDFFDVGGTMEELENLIQLIHKYRDGELISTQCCSENVEILYSALSSTICELGNKAFAYQGRCLKGHITETWLDLLKAHLNEAKWSRNKLVPTMREYMANGVVTFAMGPVLVQTLYFLGPQLSDDAIQSPLFKQLLELLSTYGRITNDIVSHKREIEVEGKLNSVTVQMIHSGAEEEEGINALRGVTSSMTREILRMCILEEEEEEDKLQGSNNTSVIPRECRYLFWRMNVMVNVMYLKEDRYTSDKFVQTVKNMLQQPICIV